MALTSDPVSRPGPSGRWWAFSLMGVVGLMAAWGFLHHHTPGQSAFLPPCLFHSLTGLLCTGCGITRATHALAHGNVALALSMNPLAVVGLPAGALVWINEGLGRPARFDAWVRWLRDARVWAAVVLIFTVARNVPGVTFLGP